MNNGCEREGFQAMKILLKIVLADYLRSSTTISLFT